MPNAWELAERLAEALLRRGDAGRGEQYSHARYVDVHALAESLLGRPVTERRMPQAGRLVPHDGGWAIHVASTEPWVRRRFSISHELAHWQLQRPGRDAALVAEALSVWRSHERLCETIAGALLLPRASLTSHFAGFRHPGLHPLASVFAVATPARVSLAAAVVRLREIHGWRHTLLHWTLERGHWLYDGEAGVHVTQLGRVTPSDATTWVLQAARARGQTIQKWTLPMVVGRGEVQIEAEVLVRRDTAVALTILPAEDRARPAAPSATGSASPRRAVA